MVWSLYLTFALYLVAVFYSLYDRFYVYLLMSRLGLYKRKWGGERERDTQNGKLDFVCCINPNFIDSNVCQMDQTGEARVPYKSFPERGREREQVSKSE